MWFKVHYLHLIQCIIRHKIITALIVVQNVW
jgi:hypothetical protein